MMMETRMLFHSLLLCLCLLNSNFLIRVEFHRGDGLIPMDGSVCILGNTAAAVHNTMYWHAKVLRFNLITWWCLNRPEGTHIHISCKTLFPPKLHWLLRVIFFYLARINFNNIHHTPSGVELSCSICMWTWDLIHPGFLHRRISSAYHLHSVVMSSLLCPWLRPHQIAPQNSKKQLKFELEFSLKRI